MDDGRPAALPPYIPDIEALREHLQAAIELEHSTIPPYLCALYSIRPGQNAEAAEIIRTVAVQEMLHFVLAANVLNAVGGAPTIDAPLFVPDYPAKIPVGQGEPLLVPLRKFSPDAIDTFLAIERPAPPPPVAATRGAMMMAPPVPVEPGQLGAMIRNGEIYGSIGDFYAAIEQALRALEEAAETTIFTGAADRQIGPELYYNAGGEVIVVEGLDTALRALEVIVDQGEGYEKRIEDCDAAFFGQPSEVAHYYRYNQIKLGQYYLPDDTPAGGPTGPTFPVSYGDDAVYDMIDNPKIASFPAGEVRERAARFAEDYTDLLKMLHRAVNGEPDQLIPAVVQMFTLKEKAIDLLRNPAPQGDGNAGPCFEYRARTDASVGR